MLPPTTAHWIVAHACNYHCPFCYMPHCSPASGKDRRWVLDKLADNGMAQITLTGGEALLAPDLDDLIHHAAKVGIPPVLHTNGSLLTRERVQRWAPDLACIRFGLEGASLTTADGIREHSGHLKGVLQGIAWAREFGIGVGVQTMVSSENIHELPALAELFGDALPAHRTSLWFLSEFAPFRLAAQEVQRFSLPPGAFQAAVSALPKLPFRVWSKTNDEIGQTAYLYIDPNGGVFTRDSSTGEDVTVGNLADHTLQALWDGVLNLCPTGPWLPK